MATQKQRQAARKNVKKAQSGAQQKKTIFLGQDALGARARGREGRGTQAWCIKGHRNRCRRDDGHQLRREAARLGTDGRFKMGKAQLIRALGQKRRFRSS